MTEGPSFSSRMIGLLAYGLGVAFLAGCVHIVSVLAMPHVAPRDAYSRIAALMPPGKMTLLQDVAPNSSEFAFEDPATALGACRYDLGQGPLQILADLEAERMMLFSFHSRYGEVFYSMSDRVAPHGRLDVLVLTSSQLTAFEANDSGDELPKELRIVAPSERGFLLVRAFASEPYERDAARNAVASVRCSVTQAPQS